MSDLPSPKSFEQLNADMLSTYAAKQGINDFNVGSAVTGFFETVALTTARASGDFFQILRDFSVDRAKGDALKRLAKDNNVLLKSAKAASSTVTVIDSSFTKVSTKVYAGSNPPNIGSTQIKISSNIGFSVAGNVYIGRGTNSVEGPIPYTSIVSVGGYFVLNLSVATTKFHNLGESVILAQGGTRSIAINTIAVSPSFGSSPDIQFLVTSSSVILDGEVQVDSVQVSAVNPGISGNVPRGAIKQFATAPFPSATVTNTLPFTNGQDSDNDDQLRVRIKRALASKGLGTETAIKSAVTGITASDEQATIVSTSIVKTINGSILYIDDGKGYESKSNGVGIESIVDQALGGEQYFALATGGRQAQVAKAFLQSTLTAPFDIIGGDTLSITVGGITYQHIFSNTDFRSPGGATTYEIASSVNSNSLIKFESTTSGGGQFIVFRARNEGNDSLQIAIPTTSGRNAAVQLGLPSNQINTLRLYKNKIPLSKDGNTASIFSQAQALWSSTVATGETLVLSVDGTALITYTINDSDFIATGLYNSVAATNSLASWAQVLNSKLTGVTTTVVGQQLSITSNLGTNNRASIALDPSSTLVTKGMFSALVGLSLQGSASDYILSRNTAQILLVTPLVAGDELTAGNSSTQARIKSAQIPGGSITFTSDGHIWILVDSQGKVIPTGVGSNTNLSIQKPSTNIIRFTSNIAGAFLNVRVNDYVIVWSSEVDPTDRLEGRVYASTSTSIDISVTPAEWAAAAITNGIVYQDGLIILRSTLAPQKFRIVAGTKSVSQIAAELATQTAALNFSVQSDQYLIIKSLTKDSTGKLLVVTSDIQGKYLNIPSNSSDYSKDSLIAYYDSGASEASFPLFVHTGIASNGSANPIDTFINSFQSAIDLSSRDPNELVSILNPYGPIADAQPYGEYVQETSLSGTTVNIKNQSLIRRLRSNDRFYVASPLDFGSKDTAVAILDNDTGAKSFEIPFYRRGITNTGIASNPSNFNAYDTDSGASANFSSAFGPNFDFSNFKVLMQAKKVLKPSPDKTAILYRAVKWGRSGEKINVGYVYPSSANNSVASTIVVGNTVNVKINFASGATILSAIDPSTTWNVTITPNTPVGIDQVTYTWSGAGTSPNLALSGGQYANISAQTGLNISNTGIFRISTQAGFAPSTTSFTVTTPTGVAVAENGKATLVNNAINFYNASPTTAAQIVTYVSANISDFVSATLVNDVAIDGSGVIVLSTYEDSGFVFDSVSLKDGINWIASSNLSASPQFVFKKPLALSTDVGYAFNNGEEVRLIPTTMDQVARLTSILAVSGFVTVGTIGIVDRGTRIELATSTLGSSGAVQVIGGLGNNYQIPVLDSAIRIDNSIMSVSLDRVAAQGAHSDQWFRLQSSIAQKKDTFFSSNTSISIASNSPTFGQSTVTLASRALNQRYFGRPRNHVRVKGNTFRVEKQGSLVCISWNGQGSSPNFLKSVVNFNDISNGTINVSLVSGTSEAQYQILSGNANFSELSMKDIINISGLPIASNNGSFLVTGVSDDGKTIRVLNPKAASEFSSGTFTFTGNSTAGDSFTIGSTVLVAGTHFAIGINSAATAINLAAVAGTISNISAKASGSVVKITAQFNAASIALAYSGTPVVTTSGPFLVGDSFVAGNFSASTSVSEGDSVILSAPFSFLNQGTYRTIRRFNDSIWIENSNAIEEEVVLVANTISLGIDATTSLRVDATGKTLYLNWNGVGTEPSLQNAAIGDVVTFGTDFAATNQGDFMVVRSSVKLQEIDSIVVPNGTQFTIGGVGTYFTLNSAGNVNKYYVWFNVNGSNTDPAPAGLTGVLVAILNGDSAITVAAKLATAILGGTTGLAAVANGNTAIITTVGYQETIAPANVTVPAPFSVTTTQAGRRTFLECLNASATSQSPVFVTAILTCNRPQIQFYEYESSIAGDVLVVSGDILGLSNAGSYQIVKIIDRNTAIINGSPASALNVSMNGRETAIYVQEGIPYSGYKRVLLATAQPGAPTRSYLVFDTNAQFNKINQASLTQIVSINKLSYNTSIRKGLDSYRYSTGLIAESNRVIYGDPRDPETYPGVGALGADVFVSEPLSRRIQVSIIIRAITGAPFPRVAEQVRTSVSSLINSNSIGNSIAISAVISAVNAIPGIRAVSINSPQYDSTHDIIFLAPSEKARIIDPTTDISVSLFGS